MTYQITFQQPCSAAVAAAFLCFLLALQSDLMAAGARLGLPATEEAALLSGMLHADRYVGVKMAPDLLCMLYHNLPF